MVGIFGNMQCPETAQRLGTKVVCAKSDPTFSTGSVAKVVWKKLSIINNPILSIGILGRVFVIVDGALRVDFMLVNEICIFPSVLCN